LVVGRELSLMINPVEVALATIGHVNKAIDFIGKTRNLSGKVSATPPSFKCCGGIGYERSVVR
jgi:hypothetical protein